MRARIIIAGIWTGCLALALFTIELYVEREVDGQLMLLADERFNVMWPVVAAYGGHLAVIALLWRIHPFKPIRSKALARFQLWLALLVTIALNAWVLYFIGRPFLRASNVGAVPDLHTAAQLAAWGAILAGPVNALFFGTTPMPAGGRAPAAEVEEAAQAGRVTVLFVANNPLYTRRLRLDKEYGQIDKNLRASAAGRRINALNPGLISRAELGREILDHGAAIVHFSGHGDRSGRLLFEDANGVSTPASIAALADLFRLLKGTVRCVVLNACFSRAQAEEIRKYVDCVVGMSSEIEDPAAIDFAAGFYGAIGAGMSIQDAFDFGCQAIEAKGVIETDRSRDVHLGEAALDGKPGDGSERKVPVLLCRDGIDPSVIKLLE